MYIEDTYAVQVWNDQTGGWMNIFEDLTSKENAVSLAEANKTNRVRVIHTVVTEVYYA